VSLTISWHRATQSLQMLTHGSRGPEAAAYPNSVRVRIDSVVVVPAAMARPSTR
jgi:hypothetical protein